MLGEELSPGRQDEGALASFAARFTADGACPFGFADWDTARDHATGGRVLFVSNRGLLVGLSALKSREAWSEPSVGEDYLKFHFRLEGEHRIQMAGEQSHRVRAGRCSIISHPCGLEKEEWRPDNSVETSVTLACKAPLLGEYFEQRASELPVPLREFLNRGSTDFWWRAVPMNVDMHVATRSLLASMIEGQLAPLQLEALSLQLLYLGISSLERGARETPLLLSNRDLRVIEHAARVLQREFANPPRIGQLARYVGMNDAKLCAGFKQAFGMTISAYTRHLRMQRAKELLEGSGLSIVEVALEVGYSHSSNFATAFKRHFGIAPRQARRGSQRGFRPGAGRQCRPQVPAAIAFDT